MKNLSKCMTDITEKPAGKAGESQSGHSVTKFATDLPHLMNHAMSRQNENKVWQKCGSVVQIRHVIL